MGQVTIGGYGYDIAADEVAVVPSKHKDRNGELELQIYERGHLVEVVFPVRAFIVH